MPLNNLNNTARHQRFPSKGSSNSINQMPADQMSALTRNIANATISEAARSQSSSVVEKNFQDLQEKLSSLSRQISFKVDNQELKLCVRAPEVSRNSGGNLPIFFMEDIKDTIDLSASLPATLQGLGCTSILDLLKANFPRLTSSSFFNKETKIPRFIFSSPIPLNHEGKGNFFPQIESEGQIAYIAWDSSGFHLAKGFKEKTCDILLENKEAFCGVALSQANLEGIEKGAGVSAHFMTSKIMVIGILVIKLPTSTQSWWLGGGRISSDGPELPSRVACDSVSGFRDLCRDDLNERGLSSRSNHTTFGMLGVQGASVSSAKQDLSDRFKNHEERLIPFCLEIVPQFSSKQNPVQKDDLVMAIETLFQEKILAQFRF
ncbi:hypothetical protein [Candidatus Rhabdochlamydia sp. T3358]|uniref:hypothetical protein n=1 Tax=Candidatus Rhabdochlamydia sp. T3358 TaxID=2099795 RepID=UPI0010BAB5EB|nr:hypothetical protein [Candidatus Rhabdochlamydia sp. T3358]VHO03895.1 hypothetical protein RHT_01100 [Candidatus Rhabdochlamydia sp. T3358]